MRSIQSSSDYTNPVGNPNTFVIDDSPSSDQSTSKIRRLFDRFVDGLLIVIHHVPLLGRVFPTGNTTAQNQLTPMDQKHLKTIFEKMTELEREMIPILGQLKTTFESLRTIIKQLTTMNQKKLTAIGEQLTAHKETDGNV